MSLNIAPLEFKTKPIRRVSINVLLRLISTLKKNLFSRKLYQEINDKVLSKASTVDTNLYFICYFTLLCSSVANNKGEIQLFLSKQKYNLIQLIHRAALTFAQTDLKLSSNKVVKNIFSTPDPVTIKREDKPSQLGIHLKKISSYLSDIRIFNRLTDSIKYMPWIIDEYALFRSPGSAVPKMDRFINLLQSLNCLVLELLENAGWLTEHDWVGTLDNNYWCIETYIWCSRVWGAYLLIEIVELFRRTPVSKWDKTWKIAVFKQMIQVPLVVHWSLYEGCLTPFWVGLCGCGASWWDFRTMWSSIDLS